MQSKLLINGAPLIGCGAICAGTHHRRSRHRRGNHVSLSQRQAQSKSAPLSPPRILGVFKPIPKQPLAERAEILLNIADCLEQNQDELAELESLDVGKPVGPRRGMMKCR